MSKFIRIASYLFFLTFLIIISLSVARAENCTEDVWTCTDWSVCSPNGTQIRTCTLESMCPNADNDKPLEIGYCEYITSLSSSLKCSDLDTARKRIACRLELSEYLSNGSIVYMPEECKNIYDSSAKDMCIKFYSAVLNCDIRKQKIIDQLCLKNYLELSNPSSRKNACTDDACLSNLRTDVYSFAKAQIYVLQLRVEILLAQKKITQSQATDIIFKLDSEILAFNNAKSKQERVDAINAAKNAWKNFVK